MLKMVTALVSTECEKYNGSVGLFMLFLIETRNYTIRMIHDWSDKMVPFFDVSNGLINIATLQLRPITVMVL